MTIVSSPFFALDEEVTDELTFFRRGEDFVFVILELRGCAASLRFEFQTASAGNVFLVFSMKGFGRGPLPAAISAIVRPEATERSSATIASPSFSRANSSRCLINSQLVRLLPLRSRFIRTSTQLPCRRSPSSLNFRVPALRAASGESEPSGVQ